MPKTLAPQALTLVTLSGMFETSRDVCRITKIDICSTYDRLAQQLKTLATNPKSREDLIRLHHALDRLDRSSEMLGLTTLVQPSEHPLVVRYAAPVPRKKD